MKTAEITLISIVAIIAIITLLKVIMSIRMDKKFKARHSHDICSNCNCERKCYKAGCYERVSGIYYKEK